jgi:stage II sporulation protein D
VIRAGTAGLVGTATAAFALALLAWLGAGCAPIAVGSPPSPAPPAPTPIPAPADSAPAPPPVVPPREEPPPQVLPPDGSVSEPALDIGLAWELDTTSVGFDGVQSIEVQSSDRPGVHSTGGPLALRVSGAQLLVTPRNRPRAVPLLVLHAGDTLWVGPETLVRGETAAIRWNGQRWRGRFKVFMNARRKLTVATRIELEPYLKGVVPGEIGALADSLLEAGRAQAVAARSYTLFYKGRRGAEGFDLYSTVEDQVYVGESGERPLATRCVESTSGLVALSGGVPIRANYYSTCGGITAEAWEAWPTGGYPYLTSHLDAGRLGDHCLASPHHRWREEWTAAEFTANLERFGRQFGVVLPAAGVGQLQEVRVAERSRSGRVWWLEAETSTGLIRVHAHMLRQVLRRSGNANSILRSNLFKVAVRRDPVTRRVVAVVASGAGFGHGVGLCQVGALGMARAGSRGENILAHYYPGASLRRLY